MADVKTKRRIFGSGVILLLMVVLTPGVGITQPGTPDISGSWNSSLGNIYNIIQIGDKFEWQVPATGEIGAGEIKGNSITAVWPFGFATGNIITDPSGWAIEIIWSNGVVFNRGPGGGGPPPGPTPGGDVNFSFGPNPARPGGEVWLDLTDNVGNQIQVFLNGVHLPIINIQGQSYVVVGLPMNVTTGHLEIEYQGRRIQSNQPHNILEIMPIDISGNWRNKAQGFDYQINQHHDNYDVTWTNPGAIFIVGTDKGNGKVYNGDKMNVHWGAKPPSMNLNGVGNIVDVNPDGRAHRIQWNGGDVWERP